jgi:hypothetical protein
MGDRWAAWEGIMNAKRVFAAILAACAGAIVGSHEASAFAPAVRASQALRAYSPMSPDEARALVVQLWAKKRFPPPPAAPLSYWELPPGKLDARGFRFNDSDYVVLARATQAAKTYVADSIVKGGGCFVAASLLFASTEFTVGSIGAGAGSVRSAPRLRSGGGYILSVGEEGVLLSSKEELMFVSFNAPIEKDPCNTDGLSSYEVDFVVSADGVVARLAGRAFTLK